MIDYEFISVDGENHGVWTKTYPPMDVNVRKNGTVVNPWHGVETYVMPAETVLMNGEYPDGFISVIAEELRGAHVEVRLSMQTVTAMFDKMRKQEDDNG